jgi:Gamma interferon inducible lysosomal thiol reductase (GILT)
MSTTLCSLLPPCAVLSLIASCAVLVLLHFDSYQASLQSSAGPLRQEGSVARDLSLYVELSRVADAVKPVKVNVYVEALCIDSKAYFENQLVPTFATLGMMIMDLDVVVFGNAKLSYNDTNGVQCQHGPGTVQARLFLLMCVRTMKLMTWPFLYPLPLSYHLLSIRLQHYTFGRT